MSLPPRPLLRLPLVLCLSQIEGAQVRTDCCAVSNKEELKWASKLLGIPEADLEKGLTTRVMEVLPVLRGCLLFCPVRCCADVYWAALKCS
jgi:uncharacterized protein (UPF0216 family)